jgi:hypothetical protein
MRGGGEVGNWGSRGESRQTLKIFTVPFYLQSVPVKSANCVKSMLWHIPRRRELGGAPL